MTTETQFDEISIRVSALEKSLGENTDATKRIEANTADIVEFTASIKGAMKVLNWIGAAARPLGYIAAFVAAVVGIFTAMKGGGVTPK